MHFIPGIITMIVSFGILVKTTQEEHISTVLTTIYLSSSFLGFITVKKKIFHQYNTKFPSDPGMALLAFALAWPYAATYYISVWYGILLGTIKRVEPVAVKKSKQKHK